MKIPLVIALLMAGVCSLQARIGETVTQITTRYGQAYNNYQSPHGETCGEYRLRDIIIVVTFFKDVSISESYHHVSGGQLKDSEIDALLKVNSSGGKWEKKDKIGNAWNILKDGQPAAAAEYNPKNATLIVKQEDNGDMSGF
jgi:hypothetical protein